MKICSQSFERNRKLGCKQASTPQEQNWTSKISNNDPPVDREQ